MSAARADRSRSDCFLLVASNAGKIPPGASRSLKSMCPVPSGFVVGFGTPPIVHFRVGALLGPARYPQSYMGLGRAFCLTLDTLLAIPQLYCSNRADRTPGGFHAPQNPVRAR